jgi:basic membrane protein A
MKPLVSSHAAKSLRNLTIALIAVAIVGTTPLPAQAAIDPSVRIAIAYDLGGLGDGGVNDAAALGLKAVQKRFHLSALAMREVVTTGTQVDRLARIKFLAKAGYNLIIAVGADYASSIYKVAQDYPEQQFAIIGDDSVSAANVSDMDFATPELSFMAGALAAATSLSGKIAMLGAASDSHFERNQRAFQAGANFISSKVKTSAIAIPNNASFYVKGLVAQGIDSIYSIWATNSDLYTSVAQLVTAKKKVSLIGITPDQFFLNSQPSAPFLIGTGNKNYGLAISQLVESALNNQSISYVIDEANGIFGTRYRFSDGGLTFTIKSTSPLVLKKMSLAKAFILKNGSKL